MSVVDWRRLPERSPLITWTLVLASVAAILDVCVSTILGLIHFRDVGYPDSATILRIAHFVASGEIYPDYREPPYLISLYGPLTYVLHGASYGAADLLIGNGTIGARLGVITAFAGCIVLAYRFGSERSSGRIQAIAAAALAASLWPLAEWTTQIRGDLFAAFLGLASVFLVSRRPASSPLLIGAVLAALAILIKQTVVTAALATLVWLLVSKRIRDAAVWSVTVAVTVMVGYGLVLWREPGMLSHITALRSPPIDVSGAIRLVYSTISLPIVPFAVYGAAVLLWQRQRDAWLLVFFWAFGWLIAGATSLQVGANVNYFWDPLLTSAILAAHGALHADRADSRVVRGLVLLLTLWMFIPHAGDIVRHLTEAYESARTFGERRERWHAFASVVQGHRILSDEPAVSVLSSTPEVPDPFLNSVLERSGTWTYAPIIAAVELRRYDLIIVRTLDGPAYRGFPRWSAALQRTVRSHYTRVCRNGALNVWVPNGHASPLRTRLAAVGCEPV